MTILEQRPITLAIPLREDPPGVLRVGRSRVLLELVIRAHSRGASPEEIVRMYDSLEVGDVYAVIAYYLAHPAGVDEYLCRRDEEAEAMRRKLEREQRPGPSKAELLVRALARGLGTSSDSSPCEVGAIRPAMRREVPPEKNPPG